MILGFLSFRDAFRCRLVCKACDEAMPKIEHIDLSECKSLLKAQYMLCKKDIGGELTLPLVRFLDDFAPLRRFQSINMTGTGIPFENMLTRVPKNMAFHNALSHLTIKNAAFVKSVSCPDSTCEDYFSFDVSALEYAYNLQSLHVHFDGIRQALSRYDTNCGAWLIGMEHCHARDVRIVIESPPFTSLMNDLPPYGAGGCLRDRMAFRVRIPSKVHHLYILTDCVLWLSRPAGDTYPGVRYCGQDTPEEDASEIFNMCLLSVKRPTCDVPNTQIRRVHPSVSATFQRPLVCVTSKSTPDRIYADNLARLAPGHCDLEHAEEIPHDSWEDE